MKKIIITIGFVSSIMGSSWAQAPDAEIDQVKKVVEQLFEGMRQGEARLLQPLFHTQARLLTVLEKEGVASLEETPIEEFIKAAGKPHEKTWDERIGDPVVRIDGPMATVWAPYTFYLGETFSHCGVNSFLLYLSSEGWKILQITDTRRKDHCPSF